MTPYEKLMARVQETQLLAGASSILAWDQEVKMPKGGLPYRGKQLALLAQLAHERSVATEYQDLLAECEQDPALTGDPASPQASNLRELRRSLDRLTKLPGSLVAEEAALASEGQAVWAEARKADDFSKFAPVLERVVSLLRRKAECFGWAEGGEIWDALADDYEPGCTAREVENIFTPLRERLSGLIREIAEAPRRPSDRFQRIKLPVDKQRSFVEELVGAIGFDFKRGRLDVSTHPFCSGNHPGDVRLTTRFHEDNLSDAIGSTMHEAGHGLYEQGLPFEHQGTPRGSAVSLGIHESQSRMWENQVGRSASFWRWCLPRLKEHFGGEVAALSFDDVYGGVNRVEPSLIRVEADEATYNLHIMIRFELERRMLSGDLAVRDLPAAWKAEYKDALGLDVPDDARGCLQDIHWSMTAMGYFPTYTLGNLYCAQFYEKADEDLGGLDAAFERGEFDGLLTWLREHVHEPGSSRPAAELCVHVTGKPLSADPLMRHLEGKLRPLYGI
ncbi:hypothetical protein ABI59_11785 [Acidobacteria bacterium Mor1]|nr:hypothetical protein ABI59_11785 [Acidobacteria bacterium Mor1]